MKESQLILPTNIGTQIQLLVELQSKESARASQVALISFRANTGCRSDNALRLRWKDIDFDNLVVLLQGRESDTRLVPMSVKLRRRRGSEAATLPINECTSHLGRRAQRSY